MSTEEQHRSVSVESTEPGRPGLKEAAVSLMKSMAVNGETRRIEITVYTDTTATATATATDPEPETPTDARTPAQTSRPKIRDLPTTGDVDTEEGTHVTETRRIPEAGRVRECVDRLNANPRTWYTPHGMADIFHTTKSAGSAVLSEVYRLGHARRRRSGVDGVHYEYAALARPQPEENE